MNVSRSSIFVVSAERKMSFSGLESAMLSRMAAKPDARRASVPHHERMGDIHSHVLVDDFIECRFRHRLPGLKRRGEGHARLRAVPDGADFPFPGSPLESVAIAGKRSKGGGRRAGGETHLRARRPPVDRRLQKPVVAECHIASLFKTKGIILYFIPARHCKLEDRRFKLVGARGFEPPTFCSQSRRTTRLCNAPRMFRT